MPELRRFAAYSRVSKTSWWIRRVLSVSRRVAEVRSGGDHGSVAVVAFTPHILRRTHITWLVVAVERYRNAG